MICKAKVKGEVITVSVAQEQPIILIAVGALWGDRNGQLLDINFILDQSTLG